MVEGFSDDALLGGRVRLRQPRSGHRAGTDAVLLAALSGARPGEHVVDLGSGSGAVGLMIAARIRDVRLTLVEREPELVELARQNLRLNDQSERSTAVALDAFSHPSTWPRELARQADLVVTNPPFFDSEIGMRASPEAARRGAHVMRGGGIAEWVEAAAGLATSRGRIALIHRADALAAVLAAMSAHFGSLVIRPVQPRIAAQATRVLVLGKRNGRAALVLQAPLVLHMPDGSFMPEAAELHEAGAAPS